MADSMEEELARRKDLSSYPTNYVDLAPAKKLLEKYSHIPPDQIDDHIAAIVRHHDGLSHPPYPI